MNRRLKSLATFIRRANFLGRERSEEVLCWFCLERPADTKDHFIPRARLKLWGEDGIKYPENVIPACRQCNELKANLPIWDWIKKLYWRQKVCENLPFKFKIGDTDAWQRFLSNSVNEDEDKKPNYK
jgi:5-methylcytosine-specific restriction endonuclease McrA